MIWHFVVLYVHVSNGRCHLEKDLHVYRNWIMIIYSFLCSRFVPHMWHNLNLKLWFHSLLKVERKRSISPALYNKKDQQNIKWNNSDAAVKCPLWRQHSKCWCVNMWTAFNLYAIGLFTSLGSQDIYRELRWWMGKEKTKFWFRNMLFLLCCSLFSPIHVICIRYNIIFPLWVWNYYYTSEKCKGNMPICNWI